MKSFKYLHNSTSFIDCTNIEDEVCNGGPTVWDPMPYLFECIKPCKIITYTGPVFEVLNDTHTIISLVITKKIETHFFFHDTLKCGIVVHVRL